MASINYIGDVFCYLKVSKELASSSLLPTHPWSVSTILISPSSQHSPLVTKQLCQQFLTVQFSSVQLLSPVRLFVIPWITARQASLSITKSQSLLKLMPSVSVMPSSHLILCHPLLLHPQSLWASGSFPTSQLFAWGGKSIGVSDSASVLPIFFRMDCLDLLAVQGTLKSLLQHHSSKA